MKSILAMAVVVVTVYGFGACEKFPVDEDNLIITTRSDCYVSSFDLLGEDHQTVTTKSASVDTVAQTITVEVKFGTNLCKLWPRFTLCEDAKLEPKVTGWTDFSDLDNPRQWTVVSGNRKIRKTYTVYITGGQP